MTILSSPSVIADAEIRTWFGVGGRADLLAAPRSIEDLVDLLREHRGTPIRVLGDGANLLVHDDGVDGLVLSLEHFGTIEQIDGDAATLRIGAGANLPKLITRCVRDGLAGLEGLAGIPASVGGAVRMNAGGAFGEIAKVIRAVDALRPDGTPIRFETDALRFGYRRSGLEDLIITSVEVELERTAPSDRGDLRQRLKDVMAFKKRSQPLADHSAGCIFKNPEIAGARQSAGRLIDEDGCKGMRVGGAEVSSVHANFIVTHPGCRAGDVIGLMDRVRTRVAERHRGVTLDPEVVIWQRGER